MYHRNRVISPALLIAIFALVLSACGGGGGAVAPQGPALLKGSDSTVAGSALVRVEDTRAVAADISNGFLLRRLLVTLQATATIGQVNAAGRAVGALGITSAEPGSLVVLFEVPRQPDVAALQALAKKLRSQPGIAFAWPGQTARTAVLPEFSPGVPVATEGLSHLLANRFPQAWNARAAAPADCLPRSVSVYVWDEFGDLNARPNFFLQVDASSFIGDPSGPGPSQTGHGYDVTTVLAGRFDANTPTGVNGFKDCLLIHEEEADGLDFLESIRRVVRHLAADGDARVVLTTSLNFRTDGFCGPQSDQACDAASVRATPPETLRGAIVARATLAGEWARLNNAAGLATKVLFTQSAGNVDPEPAGFLPANYLGFRTAGLSSAIALATQITSLTGLLTDTSLWAPSTDPTLPTFTFDAATAAQFIQSSPDFNPANATSPANLLIVDSGTDGEVLEDIKQSDFSYLGADVRAVGENIVLDGNVVKGSSFSTPQVAGLVAYLWNLSPSLLAQPVTATVDLIRRTSRTTANSPTVPVVDAYAAVLQLDNVTGSPAAGAPGSIRRGLLDANADGVFDALDLQKFAAAFGLANPDTPTIPASRDFSRFDLNGDGYTGGIVIAAFDLDVNGLDDTGQARINTVEELVEGFDVGFNEAALSDIQVLCYYAYSPAYATDGGGQNDQLRTQLLGAEHCVGARVNARFPSQITSASTLNVGVEVPSSDGQFVPAGSVLVDFTPTCATVNPSSGRTDAGGAIATSVTPLAGCASVSVTSTVRANVGTPVLAHQTVEAAVVTSGNGHLNGTIEQSGTETNLNHSFTTTWSFSADVSVKPDTPLSNILPLSGSVTGTFHQVTVGVTVLPDSQRCTLTETVDGTYKSVSGFVDTSDDTVVLILSGPGTSTFSGTKSIGGKCVNGDEPPRAVIVSAGVGSNLGGTTGLLGRVIRVGDKVIALDFERSEVIDQVGPHDSPDHFDVTTTGILQ